MPAANLYNGDRLLADLRSLADFGRWKTGVHRPTYTPQDMAARKWLAARMAEAGLDPVIDGIGNVFGHSRNPGKRMLLGSHVETQPHSGWLDGALGVIYGLEAARALPHLPIDVVGWADEEGHFATFLGSRSFAGQVDDATIDALANRDDGTKLRSALAAAGLADLPRATLDPDRYRGYLEAHIEQGIELESAGDRLGVVTGIVGIENYRLEFAGTQNHAGTTRMAIRRDAAVALMHVGVAITTRFAALAEPETVWTMGRIDVVPGAPSIVPGEARMTVQFRDIRPAVLAHLRSALHEIVESAGRAGPCEVRIVSVSKTSPTEMDSGLRSALAAAAALVAPGRVRSMPSGAGHDAKIMASRLPAAMLFIPSIGGISHHHTENTADEDIVLGGDTLTRAVAAILTQPDA